MKRSRLRSLASVSLVSLVVAAAVPAQGTRADYERSSKLRLRFADKIFKSSVKPRWIAGGTHLWYMNLTVDGTMEYVLVDAEKGERALAFDHARLAKALTANTRTAYDARILPISKIDLGAEGGVLFLAIEGRWWRLELSSYTLKAVDREAPATSGLRASSRPRRSARTGDETWITFVNRTDSEVRILWSATDGARRPYATLAPGARHRQHTFAGHVWLATDAEGKIFAVFEAVEGGGEAIVDGRPIRNRGRGSRGQRGRPEGRPSRGPRSPDGRFEAFFKDHDLHLRDLRSKESVALTSDGNAENGYGGRVYWSPGSRRLVVLRTAAGEDRQIHFVESAPKGQLQPKLHTFGYTKPGDRIAVSKPHLFDAVRRKEIAIDDALFETPWSLSRLRWDADGKRFTFLYNQRGHRVMRVVAVDAQSGKTRAIVDERCQTFFDYAGKLFLHPLEKRGELIWMSERDGWNHLYLIDATRGKVKRQLTRGAWVVRGVERVDEEKGQVWFRAGGIRPGQDPYHEHFARVDLDGKNLVVLTAGDGTHRVEYSPDGRRFIDTWSRVDHPPVSELRSTADGSLLCELERADWSGLQATGWQVPERFVAKGRDGETDIWGVIFRPTNFDPQRRYPVIENIYAGPHSAHVPKSFRAFHGSQAMAELGFVVVRIDGMGTSHRSKAFHDVAWKNLADAGFPDRVRWIRAAAAERPWMDIERIGIYGGSAGGQNAMRGLLDHPGFYKVGVADCGCHDNRMDKIWWNELWMSWPIGPHYEKSSNVIDAHKLQGKLLLIVGERDRNVDPASTMQVVDALIKADKDFDLLVVPGAGHGAAGTPYGRRRQADFFVRHLLGVEPRS